MDTDVTEPVTTDAPADPPATPPAANSRAAWIVAGVMTAIALIAAMVAVSAVMRDDDNPTNVPAGFQSAGFSRPVTGKITDIDGSSFTVKETAPNGITTTSEVETTEKTTFRQSINGSLSDLAVGDTIAVSGTTTDNVLTAERITETAAQTNIVRSGPGVIMEGGPMFSSEVPAGGSAQIQGGGPPRVFRGGPGNGRIGKITKVEGDTITLDALDGQAVTVKTTASTVVRVNKSIKLGNLEVGDTVRVFGPMSGSKIAATEVTKGPAVGGAGDDALAS